MFAQNGAQLLLSSMIIEKCVSNVNNVFKRGTAHYVRLIFDVIYIKVNPKKKFKVKINQF